jgi:hypothetical protein
MTVDDRHERRGPADGEDGPAGPDLDAEAAWGFASPGESRWPATIAVALATILYVRLPARLIPGPRLLVPGLEVALLIPLMVANPARLTSESRDMRWVSVALIALINAANLATLVLLIDHLLSGTDANGEGLIRAAIAIWLTQVIVFGLWYWEIDRGGPIARTCIGHRQPDMLFTQMTTPAVTGRRRWVPTFPDYLYVSVTNSTAFSPTDTMPLTIRIKMLMGAQGMISLATIAIVGARAVNILK